MKRFLLVALVTALSFAGSASAADLGLVFGSSSSGAQSQVAAQSVGGSFSALAGLTAQGSQAAASNASFGNTRLVNNDTHATSGTAGQTSQGGGSFALGGALSANGNMAQMQGLGEGINSIQTIALFVTP